MFVPFWFTSCESDQIRRYFTWYLCIATSQLWKFYWSFRLRWNFTNDFFIDQVNMITGLFFICIVIIVKNRGKHDACAWRLPLNTELPDQLKMPVLQHSTPPSPTLNNRGVTPGCSLLTLVLPLIRYSRTDWYLLDIRFPFTTCCWIRLSLRPCTES